MRWAGAAHRTFHIHPPTHPASHTPTLSAPRRHRRDVLPRWRPRLPLDVGLALLQLRCGLTGGGSGWAGGWAPSPPPCMPRGGWLGLGAPSPVHAPWPTAPRTRLLGTGPPRAPLGWHPTQPHASAPCPHRQLGDAAVPAVQRALVGRRVQVSASCSVAAASLGVFVALGVCAAPLERLLFTASGCQQLGVQPRQRRASARWRPATWRPTL